MSLRAREAEGHRLIAGDAALNFANTLNGHDRSSGHEYLHDFADLALWCRHSGILTGAETRQLLVQAARHPLRAVDLYRRTLALREVIFRIFRSIAVGSHPSGGDLARLNASWREAQKHAQITGRTKRFSIRWAEEADMERIPRALSAAAVNTLVSEKTERIKTCSGDGCDWLFIDSSRNHLRRWCSMDECGNRAKMRRRQRRKSQARRKGQTARDRLPPKS